MKHKHADLIHAWADGAKIQFWSDEWNRWVDLLPFQQPYWASENKYRIKPEEKKPVVRWLWAYPAATGMCYTSRLYSLDEATGNDWIKLEWSRTEFPE